MPITDQDQLSRRKWLGVAACLSGGAASGVLGDNPRQQVNAMEPLGRTHPNFKFSLAAYSYRNLLTAESNPLDLFDFVDDCAKFNLQGTELTSYYFPAEPGDELLRRLKRHCFLQGLDISGTAIRNDFGLPAGPKRAADLAHVKRWIEYAQMLGAPVIRIFAGHVHDQTEAETHRLMVDGMQECCEYAGRFGVTLALENHGGPTSTAKGLLTLVRAIDSEWFGVNLDTGNFHSDDVYGELTEVAPYAVNVQVKATISDASGKKSKTDFARIASILKNANYRGYVVLEFEEKGDPRTECPRLLTELQHAFLN